MRKLILLALVAAVAATSPWYNREESVRESIFRPGVEYVYRYESEALTGIRSVSDQLTGVKVRSTVKVQFHRDGTWMLKMEDVNVYKINNGVTRKWRYETVPEQHLTRLTGEEERIMVEKLVKPIKFRMSEGEIRDVQTEQTDEYWSINIKKGLVSLFQVKINGRSTISDSPVSPFRSSNRFSEMMNPMNSRSRFGFTAASDKIFKVMERDVNGECETKYVINSEPSSDLSSVSNMFVTKVKNFDKCLTRNSFELGLFAGLPHYDTEKKLIQPSMEAEYELSGDRQHFLIRKAMLEAKYIFTPYGQEAGQISSHIVQRLELLTTREIETPISYSSWTQEKKGLKMEIPRAEWSEEETSQYRHQESRSSEWEHKKIIEKLLTQLLSAIYPVMHESSSRLLMELNLVVRDVPSHHLFTIVKSYLQNSDELSQKKSEILLDILPTIQTPEVAKVLIDLIRDESIRGIRSRLSIAAMSLSVKPAPEVAQRLMSLYKEASSLERHTPMLRKTILLSVGTLGNKMIMAMKHHQKPIPQLMTVVEELSSEMMRICEQAQSEQEKILILKAMGNFGSKEFISVLGGLAELKSESVVVRTQVIWTLRKIAKSFEKQVHPILVKILMDKQEPEQMRAAAFMVLKKSHPSFTTLQLIAHSLLTEPSRQIKTLIHSSLINMATDKSDISEIRFTSNNARKVLKVMRAMPVGIVDSKELSGEMFSEKLELGGKLSAWGLKSETTGLPKNLVAALRATIFGNHVPLLSGGVESRGIETILRRLLGPYGLLKDIVNNRATLYELLRPLSSPHFGIMADKIREFIGRRAYEPRMEEEIKGLIYGEILGHEICYTEFDNELVERLMQFAVRSMPQLISSLKEGLNVNAVKTFTTVQNSLIVPTPMGVPLSLNVSAAAVLKLEGIVKANSLPEVSDFLLRRPYMNRKIEIMTDIKPSWNVNVFGNMGVDMRWIRSATGIKAVVVGNLPIKGELIVDPVDSKIVVKYDPPTQRTHVITAKVEPMNVVWYIPSSMERLPWTYEAVTIQSRENARTSVFEKNVQLPKISSAFDVKVQFTKCMSNWCAYLPLTGKQEITAIYTPLEASSTKEIVFKIQKFSQNLYEEQGVENNFWPHSRTSSFSRNYRLESREMTSSDEFVPVDVESVISSPRKIELLMELGVRGIRSEKKVQAKVTWITENNYLEHQFNVQVVGVANEDIPQFKLMMNGLLRCPMTIESLSHQVETGDILGKLDVFWGSNNFRENAISAKWYQLSNSAWTSELEREGVEHYWPNDYLQSVTPMVFNYALEVELPRMSPEINWTVQKYMTYVLDFIKMKLYNHVKVAMPQDISQNKIVVLGQYVSKLEKMSVIIKTPRETDFLLDIPLRCQWLPNSWWSLHDMSPLNSYSNYSRLSMELMEQPWFDSYKDFHRKFTPSFTGMCKVHSDKMLTFDGVPIILPTYTSETPSSRCRVLLAQDCSQRGLFSVSGSFKLGRWAVKMVVPSYELELVPESSSMDSISLIANGRPITLSSSMPVELPSIISPSSSESSVVVVEKVRGEGVKINMKELGLTVMLSSDNKILIKMSPMSMLQGKLCGLCGNNNYDSSDDMTALDSQRMTSSRMFVMDNLLPSSYCDASDYETQLGLRHQGFCKKEKTWRLERMTDDTDEVCFSRTPIPACRSHCSAETTMRRTVNLVCLPRHSIEARQLVAKYHSGQTLLTDELRSIQSSARVVTKEIEVPEKCVSKF